MGNNKTHFFFKYYGNKRMECPFIFENIEKDIIDKNIKTVIEPYCGSCAFSVFLSNKYPKKFTYVLNDLDENLIKLFRMCRENGEEWKTFVEESNKIIQTLTSQEKFSEVVKKNDFMGWFIGIKLGMRKKYLPSDYNPKKYDYEILPIVSFIRNENIEFLNKDGMELYLENCGKCDTMLFIDPPYLFSDNNFYSFKKTGLYEYCRNNSINNEKAFIVFSLAKNKVVDSIFSLSRRYVEYQKFYTYIGGKKEVVHIVISN